MKTLTLVSALALFATLGAGCAAPDAASSSSEPREQPEYRTGSNLPVRTAKPKTKEERDAEEAQRAKSDAAKTARPGT